MSPVARSSTAADEVSEPPNDQAAPRADKKPGKLIAALVGNPNAGKTTIFNALTGLRQKVGNYPGVTVDKRVGEVKLPDGRTAELIDLPGTYSLVTVSLDEQVVSDVLHGSRAGVERPEAILAVVDASNLARNLFLVSQLLDLQLPTVLALNMTDVAESHGHPVDPKALSEAIGCPVVPMVGHKREGVAQLAAALQDLRPAPTVTFTVDAAMAEEERALGEATGISTREARRLLAEEPGSDLTKLRAAHGEAIAAARARLAAKGIDAAEQDIEARYRWVDGVVAKAVRERGGEPRRTLTQKVDAVLMHRVFGLVIFALIMTALFTAVFWLAKPMMDAVKDGVAWLGLKVASKLPEGPLRALVADGIFAGVGTVMVFTPQIALLFLFLAALEDSGYLARAAFLMDRVLSKVGLNGKSFIPLLSSFACAIPGILATRTIEGRRDRLATILAAPFMTCSARLPVYALLIAACLPDAKAWQQALVLFGLYGLGILAAVTTTLLLKRRLDKKGKSSFILELPTYKRPQAGQVLYQVWTNTKEFVVRAGTTICAFSIVLWALLYYPRHPVDASLDENKQQAVQIEHSFAGKIGHGIEPIVRPLGYDWKMGVGLVSAFAAREVFVSTLGITYSVGGAEDSTKDLNKAMSEDKRPDGSKVWTPLTAISLMLWFVLAMQCLSTMAVVRRETGGWKWPLLQLAFMNTAAYVLCLIVYQVGRRFFGV